MKPINISKIHCVLDKHIKLAASFTEFPELYFIIKALRLKPHSLIFTYFSNKLILHNWWIDEYGNSLIIDKDKKIKFIFNDLRIDRSKIINTDLYEHLSMNKVSKFSKLAYIVVGKEEDFYSDHIVVSFLGIDDFLRTYVYIYGEWQLYPSIFLGKRVLKKIAQNLDTKSFIKITKNVNNTVIYPCIQQHEWLGLWAPTKKFISNIEEQNKFVLEALNITKKEQ